MALIIKNTTNQNKFIKNSGDEVPALSEIRIDPDSYNFYTSAVEEGSDSEDAVFLADLSSGDLVVNDGTEDLSFSQAKKYLRTFFRIPIKLDGTEVDKSVKSLNVRGANVAVVQDAEGEITIEINSLDSVAGDLYTLTFSEDSTASNEYINSGVNGTESNATPHIIPFKSKVMAYTFSNSDNDGDVDIEIYSVPEGSGNAPTTLEDTWVLRNARTARKTNFTQDVIFEAGDKVTVYFRDQGVNPDNVVFKMYLKVLEDDITDNVETWSGDINPIVLGGDDDDD